MTRLCRVFGMILVFLLLTSARVPAPAALGSGKTGGTTYFMGEGSSLSPHRENMGKETVPAMLLPPWRSAAYDASELATEIEVEQGRFPVGSMEPELLQTLREADPDEFVRVIVTLREQVDLDTAIGQARDTTEARSRLVAALQANAARSQSSLRAYLEGAQAAGLVDSYTPFWIFNGIAVRARSSFVTDLDAHPAVAGVRLDHWRQWVTDETLNPTSRMRTSRSAMVDLQSPVSIEWGIARIRADRIWTSLHISGTGAVVAGMDTGVDWLHPALEANYRGHSPHGPAVHLYSWYDSTGGDARYPVDAHGHGSHTMGTMVGQAGIGVAPGAQWIAVKALNNEGIGYDSWIHEGFQWLLAPGGDPTKAPDVVNCSWSNDNGSATTFRNDIQVLQAAGIFSVFANGNRGLRGEGSVGSPASNPEAFAVGASDSDDEVANFSSRGPSPAPWREIRPHVVAPGVNVRSSMPGDAYEWWKGTSMAAPHVSGIVALLRSISPTLSIARVASIITSTAVPLTSSVPNNDSGWGRVDAFSAVVTLLHPGFITGTVAHTGSGAPIAGATVVAASHGTSGGGVTTTDDSGSYSLALAPSVYDLTVSAFGYEPAEAWGAVVTTDTATRVDFLLTPLPAGILQGRVTDAATGVPVSATVAVLGTPLEATADIYTFTLPIGTYTVRARVLGYQVVTTTVRVAAGKVAVADLALPPAPTILLMDSGSWYYGSQRDYFRQALDDLAYAYDEWAIKHLPDDVPTASSLTPYDIVVWSAPEDAPGDVGAPDAIIGYLSGGGRLLISGQDLGYREGNLYFRDYLKASFVRDDAQIWTLEGVPGGIFAGLTITIAGPGGADNQESPDVIRVADPDFAAPVLTYRGDGCGGIRIGTCLDYRAVYLSFGFEAINEPSARREVMARALDWLTLSPPAVGLGLKPAAQMRIGPPGSLVTHTLLVRHEGQGGITDTVALSLDGVSWATRLSTSSVTLAPCNVATVVVTIAVPFTAGWNARDVITLTALSALSHTVEQTAVITTKAPAPILLVDDDRWYNQEAKYEAALSDASLPYDYWRIGWSNQEPSWGSPALDMLQRYPIVVWFTGYDWYRPVTADEKAILAAYLDSGRRLFLSSQDFLYYHHDTPFSSDYLGVLDYTEDVTPTVASGVPENPVGDRLGTHSLDYPFRNWADAVVPTPGTAVPFRDQEHHPIALARRAGDYKTVFFSFPFEALPETARGGVMARVVGWLSWLGGSTFAADRGAASGGDVLTYTIALRNDGPATVTASLSNTLPLSLTLVPDSLTSPATYHTATRRVSWEGPLMPEATITFTYRAALTTGLPAGASVINTARIALEDQGIRFYRAAVVRMDASDLSPSAFRCGPSPARPSTVVTCTLDLTNAGSGDALAATVTSLLPADANLVPGSPTWVGGGTLGTLEVPTGTVRWTGPLSAGERVTLTYQISLPTHPLHPPLYNVAFLEDGMGGAWERTTWLPLEPLRCYLPLVLTDAP